MRLTIRKAVFLLVLLLCGALLGAEKVPACLQVSLEGTTGDAVANQRMLETVRSSLEEVLSWRLRLSDDASQAFVATIRKPVVDKELFADRLTVSCELELVWLGLTLREGLLVMGADLEEWSQRMGKAVVDQLRYDLLALVVPPLPGPMLDYVHGISLSSVGGSAASFPMGKYLSVTDYDGKSVGLIAVLDRFEQVDGDAGHTVTEYRQIHANRKLEPGMLIADNASQWALSLSFPVTLDGMGFDMEFSHPTRRLPFNLSLKSGALLAYTTFTGSPVWEASVRCGLAAEVDVGFLRGDLDSWLSNISFGFASRIGVGLYGSGSTFPVFMYGAEGELSIGCILSNRISCGLQAAFRYWVSIDGYGDFNAKRSGYNGFSIAPSIRLSL